MIHQNISIKSDLSAWWLIFSGDQLLQVEQSPGLPMCGWKDLSFVHAYEENVIQIGVYQQRPCYLVDLNHEQPQQDIAELNSLRSLLLQVDPQLFNIASRAWQVALFLRTHKFCGQCGNTMENVGWELAMQCHRCQHRTYPRVSPCIIVAIRKHNQILLAQGKHHKNGFHSTLAGFVESGESLEQAVHREVMEEVGIKIKNLQYFSSQPWPFPHQLMCGYLAEFDSGEIQIDEKEIASADWFEFDDLPLIPPKFSIAGHLIEATVSNLY